MGSPPPPTFFSYLLMKKKKLCFQLPDWPQLWPSTGQETLFFLNITLNTRPWKGSRVTLRPPFKKSLFPVQRVAIIVSSREAAKSCPPPPPRPLYRNGRNKKEKSGNMEKMCLPGPYRVTRPVDRKQNYF